MNKEDYIKAKIDSYKNSSERGTIELFVNYENETVLIINKLENIDILSDAISYISGDTKTSYNRLIYFKDITKIIYKN